MKQTRAACAERRPSKPRSLNQGRRQVTAACFMDVWERRAGSRIRRSMAGDQRAASYCLQARGPTGLVSRQPGHLFTTQYELLEKLLSYAVNDHSSYGASYERPSRLVDMSQRMPGQLVPRWLYRPLPCELVQMCFYLTPSHDLYPRARHQLHHHSSGPKCFPLGRLIRLHPNQSQPCL